MKKLLFMFAVLGLVLISCKKDDIQPKSDPIGQSGENLGGTGGTGGTGDTGCIEYEGDKFEFILLTNIPLNSIDKIGIVRHVSESESGLTINIPKDKLINHYGLLNINTINIYYSCGNIFEDFGVNNGDGATEYGIPEGTGFYVIKIYFEDSNNIDLYYDGIVGDKNLGVGFGLSSIDTTHQVITKFENGINFQSPY